MNSALQQFLSSIGSIVTIVIAIITYERLIKKDSNNLATTLAILMTKVDSLLEMNNEIKKHDEMLIRHDEEIKNLKDTNRFTKITEEFLRRNEK